MKAEIFVGPSGAGAGMARRRRGSLRKRLRGREGRDIARRHGVSRS